MSDLEMISVAEAAKILGVVRKTAWQYIGDGKLKAVRVGRSYVVSKSDLEDFIKLRDRKRKG